jgi:hypothetical protein
MDNEAYIIEHMDPAGIQEKTVTPVKPGGLLIDYLVDKYPQGNPGAALYLGSVTPGHEITPEACAEVLGAGQVLHVVHRPQGLDPLTLAVAAIVAAVVTVTLIPDPKLPNDAGQLSQSPNNNLTGQTNLARAYQAIPEVFGSTVVYPDLVQPSVFEYVSNVKLIREIFVLGAGTYDVGDVRTDKTTISDISGSSATIFDPGSVPGDLQAAVPSDEVTEQELLAPDQIIFQVTKTTSFLVAGNLIVLFAGASAWDDLQLEDGDQIIISGSTLNDGTYTTVSHAIVGGGANLQIVVQEPVVDEFSTPSVTTTNPLLPTDNWIGWFNLPTPSDEVWAHVTMPNGIQDSAGGSITVDFEIEVEELDDDGLPTGTVFTLSENISGGSPSGKFKTFKIGSPDITPGKSFRVRSRRTTNKFSGAALDKLVWEEVHSVQDYSGAAFGDVTLLDITLRATSPQLSSSTRKINADVTRKLPTWSAGGGFDATLRPSRSFADAVLYTLTQAAGRPFSEVDLATLYTIEGSLTDSRLGQFDFSFDDANVGLGDRIKTICNAARVGVYRDGQVWRFVRDQVRSFRTALFNRRNIAFGGGGTQTWAMHRPADFDSVSLRYTDPTTNKRAEIQIKIDSATSSFIEGSLGSRPKKIDLAGCRDAFQAADRARLEVRKLLRERRRVKETVLNDGLLVNPGDRVGWADIYDGEIFDGEILSQSGNVFGTSEKVTLDPGKSYIGSITDGSGFVLGPVAVAAVVGNEFAFSATFISPALIANGSTIQSGSRYLIGVAEDDQSSDFIINTRRSLPGGKVELSMVNYDPTIYEIDGQV